MQDTQPCHRMSSGYGCELSRRTGDPMSSKRNPLAELERGRLRRFSGWSNTDCPRVAAGVYTIWRGTELVFVGGSGRGLTRQKLETSRNLGRTVGLWSRLNSHASGHRSGDQLSVYVDFLVLQGLSTDQIERIAAGELQFAALVRDFIWSELTYRYVTTEDGETAFALEREVRSGALGCGPPHISSL